MNDRKCCFVGDASCAKPAVFEIGRLKPTVPTPDGNELTDGCEEHVGALLGYANEPHGGGWWVVEIEVPS